LTVVREDSPTAFKVVQNAKTEAGARTMALDQQSGNVFLVTAQRQNQSKRDHPARALPRRPGNVYDARDGAVDGRGVSSYSQTITSARPTGSDTMNVSQSAARRWT